MADCSSDDSSETAGSDSSDFEVATEGKIVGSIEPFQGIQPWRFEAPTRNSQPREFEASTSTANTDPCNAAAVIFTATSGECMRFIGFYLSTE